MVSMGTARLGELTVRADIKITNRSGQKVYLAFACERGDSPDETGQARALDPLARLHRETGSE